MTGNARGTTWSGASGESSPGQAAGLDTIFRIYSMTKAVGATAALILFDRGKLDPDAPVETILPEFADLQVLDGFDGEAPRLRTPATRATVRQLASHSSGLVYEDWHADMRRWMKGSGNPGVVSGLRKGLFCPLVFDPGTRWDYGTGIDWLGQVVEAVDGRRIDRFCQQEIFGPLGMTDTVFEIDGRTAPRLASAKRRGREGQFVDLDMAPPSDPEVYGMGHALYSTAPDYLRFLRMWLNRGSLDGNRILSEAAVDQGLANAIGDLRVGPMISEAPWVSADVDLFPGTPKTHSFGFMRVEQDVPGMRAAGSQGWAGLLNTHFWFDPSREVAGILMTQTLPFVEPPFMRLYQAFERATYQSL